MTDTEWQILLAEVGAGATHGISERVVHLYPRYGLAVATYRDRSFTDDELPMLLFEAIEDGLENFRMETSDAPLFSQTLRYNAIGMKALQDDPGLVQGKLSEVGKYLCPSVITTDGDARGTFENAIETIGKLREGTALDVSVELQRSFAPTVAKINNGTGQKNPKGTLLEKACALIATLTPDKPAAWIETRNTAIFPDLPLGELQEFVAVFVAMRDSEVTGLKTAILPKKDFATSAVIKHTPSPSKATPKSEYRRPPLFRGNYPDAPHDADAFGAAGLLAAIGRWARRAEQREKALRVLDTLKNRPLYIINYDGVSQARFGHHVVELAKQGVLAEIIDTFHRDTRLYAVIEEDRPRRDLPTYKLLYRAMNRFLQGFDAPSLRDFLAVRAEYPASIQPLFEVYFMQNTQKQTIPIERAKEIVQSARALGQWLNRTAYFVAETDVEPNPDKRKAIKQSNNKKELSDHYKSVQKSKAKILVEFESAVMSAKTSTDMLSRVSVRAGRLLQWDAPPEATEFYDAATSGEIALDESQNLLIAYLRLRSPATKTAEPDPYVGETDTINSQDESTLMQGETIGN